MDSSSHPLLYKGIYTYILLLEHTNLFLELASICFCASRIIEKRKEILKPHPLIDFSNAILFQDG